MKRIMAIMAVIVMFILLTPISGMCQTNKSIQYKQLQKEAGLMNATLPQMISKEIQLVRVVVRDYNEIAFVFKTLFYNVSELNINKLETALKPQTKNSICSKPDTLELIKRGVSYTYVYHDKENNYIGEFSVTPKDCGF